MSWGNWQVSSCMGRLSGVLIMLLTMHPSAHAASIVIYSAISNSGTVTINGAGFELPGTQAATPVVQLGNTPLTVTSASPTHISATLPLTLPDGSYSLLVEQVTSPRLPGGTVRISGSATITLIINSSASRTTKVLFSKRWYSFLTFTCCAWTAVPDSLQTVTTTGGTLLVQMNLAVYPDGIFANEFGCRPTIDGVWAGQYGNQPASAGDPLFTEGQITMDIGGDYLYSTSRIYDGVPAGQHVFEIECATDQSYQVDMSGTFIDGLVNIGAEVDIYSSWNVIEFP